MNRKSSITAFAVFGVLVLALAVGFLAGSIYDKGASEDKGGFITGAVSGVPDAQSSVGEEISLKGDSDKLVDEQTAQSTPAERIIKEYSPGDVEVLRNRALQLVKNSDCYKQEYELGLSDDEEKYRSFYSTSKVINLVYDFNEQFHGWIVFRLVRINRVLKTESLKVDIDVGGDKVSCPEIELHYSDTG